MSATGYFRNFLSTFTARRRRHLIRRLLKDVDVRELTWLPAADSPLSYRGTVVRLAMDYVIGPRTLAFGHWHDEHCGFIRNQLRQGQSYHLIDVGANAGLVSRQLLATPQLQFIGADCFEPDAQSFTLLTTNLAPFPGVTLHAAALSDSDGEAELFRGARNAGDISLTPDADLLARHDIGSQTVRLLSAERMAGQILQSLASESTRLVWKSDTQGHDLKIVAAMPDEFWSRVDVALIEVRSVPATAQEITRFMAVVETFAVRRSVKRGANEISTAWLRNFIEQANGSEFDLLLARG
jgi:FkbM family methyltransferase